MDKEAIDALEEQLNILIEASRHLGIMASNFQQQSQGAFNQKFQTLSKCLRDLDAMKDHFAEIKVPVSVFNYIDEGKNPLLYTKDCLMKTLVKNEEIKGKIVTFKTFRELLLEELGKSFPEEYDAYMKLRASENEVIADAAQAQPSQMSNDVNTVEKKE